MTFGEMETEAEQAGTGESASMGESEAAASEASEDRDAATAEWLPYPPEHEREGHTVVGTMKVMHGVRSPQLDNERDLYVYLPPSYEHTAKRYPVLYMHDGQNLFDRATSFGEEWEVDQTLEAASADGLEAIVVGVPNLGKERLNEYSPWRDRRHRAGGRGDAYLSFLTDTVKPMIDRDFRTLPGRGSTGIAGSSMGGLISLYAFFRRSDVFGFAGVMSPALWFAGGSVFPFVRERPHVPGRVYLDIGTSEGTEAIHDARRMKALLEEKGYRGGRDLLFYVEMGGQHNERAWARRLRRELHFLLGVPFPRTPPRPLDFSPL